MEPAKTPHPRNVAAASFPSQGYSLVADLFALRQAVAHEGRDMFERWRPLLKHQASRSAALNMAHYLALRARDLRELQEALTPWGLSSLGRSEARVLANLDAVLVSLATLTGRTDLPLHQNKKTPLLRALRAWTADQPGGVATGASVLARDGVIAGAAPVAQATAEVSPT